MAILREIKEKWNPFCFQEKIRGEYTEIRTANRHWWTGRVYQGKREKVVQGTRQQKLGVSYARCPARLIGGPQLTILSNCLTKTQLSAKPKGNV